MKEEIKQLNTNRVNQLISVGHKVLKVLYFLFVIVLVYVLSLIFKEWNIFGFIGKLFSIMSPLFLGWFIAWLLNPIVKRLQEKGVKKGLSVAFAFLLLVLLIILIFAFTIPSLAEQVSELVSTMPTMLKSVQNWIDGIFIKLSNMSLTNLDSVKNAFLANLEGLVSDIQTGLPTFVVNFVSAIASGIGKITLGLILGFYLLYDFDKVSVAFIKMFPKKSRKEMNSLLTKLNESLYSYVNGTLWLSLLLFVVSVIGFSIIGLKASILVSFFCVITNLIPYVGPYIGGAFAGVIGFTQSPIVGVLTLIFILVVQQLEGNILHPLVMSKKMNLNPITIIISLLIFESMFGIFGMVIATPAVALLKIIYVFLDEKYKFFEFED